MSAIVKHSWPMLLGMCAAAALLVMPGAASAQNQPIQACANKQGKIVKISPTCSKKQTSVSWNLAGPQGPIGPVGPQGAQGLPGSQGPAGPQGSAGPAGVKGATGIAGPTGATGATGPTGSNGPAGAQGPQGPAGTTGQTGATGNPGAAGTPGDNLVTLTGGDIAGNGFPGVGEDFDFSTMLSIPGTGATKYYYGPGNQFAKGTGETGDTSLPSESVPLPAGTLSNLVVQVDTAPGADQIYTFVTCINGNCTGNVTCPISGTALMTCTSASTAADTINDGDVVAIEAFGTADSASADVSWSMNLKLGTPTPTATSTPTSTPTPTPTSTPTSTPAP